MILCLCRFIVIVIFAKYSLHIVYTDVKRWQVSYIRNFLRKKKSWDLKNTNQEFHDHDISWHDTAKNIYTYIYICFKQFWWFLPTPSPMTSCCLNTTGALSLSSPPTQVLMFFAYIWLAVIVATLSWLLIVQLGYSVRKACNLAGWFWYDERMRFIEVAVLARVASDEVDAAVAVLLSSDASMEILLSHFFWFNVRWPVVEEIIRFGVIATRNKVQAYCCIFRTNWWTMTNATVCESKQFPLFLWNFICPFSNSTLKNSSSGYLADTSTNNNTNYHHPSQKKMDACFFFNNKCHTHGKRTCNTFLIPLPIRPSCCAPTLGRWCLSHPKSLIYGRPSCGHSTHGAAGAML